MVYFLFWLIPALLGLLLGVAFLNFLVVHPTKMSLRLVLACVLFFTLSLFVSFSIFYQQSLVTLGISLAATFAGYWLGTASFLSRRDARHVPALERVRGQAGAGHTAVVYLTHGEPETYDPIGWINQFREFDEHGTPFIPFLARPFFIYQLRKKYLQVGKSDHRRMHMQMLESLKREYALEGRGGMKFYLSFLDDEPRPDAAVIQALNEGARRIIVSEVFLTLSSHTQEGKELIESVDAQGIDVPVVFTDPLWDSESLRSMFVHRANQHIEMTGKEDVGVLLVGHGQPDEWDQEFPTQTEQENLFRREIIRLFIADGYREANLSLAWMEFKEPRPAKIVENFLQNEVKLILVFSAAISADSIHSQYDIPALVRKADLPEGFPVIHLGAWNNDPLVIQAIKEKIDLVMEE
jgi:protoheme ferro-lyase